MIIGSNIMDAIDIDVMYSKNTVIWGDHSIPMKPKIVYEEDELNKMWFKDLFELCTACQMVKLLDNDYAPADLNKIVTDCSYLNHEEKNPLLN